MWFVNMVVVVVVVAGNANKIIRLEITFSHTHTQTLSHFLFAVPGHAESRNLKGLTMSSPLSYKR